MNFLEATRILREFSGGTTIPFRLAMSGTPDTLTLYLRAAAAKQGWQAETQFLPFNTLQQTVVSAVPSEMAEVFLLFPWDLVPEMDWRTGVTSGAAKSESDLLPQVESFLGRVTARGGHIVFVPAPCPPLWIESERNAAFEGMLESMARSARAVVLPRELFSLGTYIASGAPFGGGALGTVAECIVRRVRSRETAVGKVVVTDLDQTLWSGIIGDDGLQGISHRAEGKGYQHFIYQTMLRRLREAGVLLAAVSKNDASTALAPFQSGEMVLKEEDFVAILASWNAKSAQIKLLAEQLNLGLDAFVFVDDNPVELAEVARELPQVTCLRFPDSASELPALLDALAHHFRRNSVTAEDQQRTQMYRRRLEGMAPSNVAGADLTLFLRELNMTLVIADRSTGDRARAVQLLNKTNQFNANGRRFTSEEVQATLDAGGKLYGVTLSDRTGEHGEILVALVDGGGIVRALVMSCRVFQRRVEFAFLAWLLRQNAAVASIEYAVTEKNEPTRRFLVECLGREPDEGVVTLDVASCRERFANDLSLFDLSEAL